MGSPSGPAVAVRPGLPTGPCPRCRQRRGHTTVTQIEAPQLTGDKWSIHSGSTTIPGVLLIVGLSA